MSKQSTSGEDNPEDHDQVVYTARALSLLLLRATFELLTCVPVIAILCFSEFLRSIDFVSQNQGHRSEEAQNYQIISVQKRSIEEI